MYNFLIITDTPQTTPYTTNYIRFSTLPYEELYPILNLDSVDLVNAAFSKAVINSLNSDTMEASFDSDQLIVNCTVVPRYDQSLFSWVFVHLYMHVYVLYFLYTPEPP